ncbi:HTH-type transcriptional regulator CymR [Novipirellula galeiformis]|uniref:HTH-type transcriptional regulator CymR n=1 Tax=Novipirellula galeiformis TaxID=2528004 RepID=A0A5C6CUH6_9BACT|nr:Rrf2 family transcriptional regulator [Novipirellula galeiformis]TWU26696.1 HTH-type transcriptional regulator CymR [Novipirellula galeiformis]
MLISARVHYACLAMLELAMRAEDAAPVAVREITDQHNIPGPFLVQILRTLRTAGWVQSVRGSQGGYRLSVDPKEITLLDVAEAMGCQEGSSHVAENATQTDQSLQRVWDKASEASREVLSSVRLSDLAEQCRYGDATMFYI